MKQFFTLIAILIITATLFGQAPQGINYQAVARDIDQKPKPNVSVIVTLKIKMLHLAQSCIPKPTIPVPALSAFST
ncbi:MAG: hypothetical protein IPG32_16820 [Saprospirales bacterium]|nr:hypothetical protein [Saprospirales bacterium]